ncbi:MAG: NUDIX domain-containing protein [bacterium]
MKAYLYILECSDRSYYTGSTTNLERCLKEHQTGNGAVHTSRRLPVRLAYYERLPNIELAAQREREVKGWSRDKKTELIKSSGWKNEFSIGAYAIITNENGEILLMKHVDREFWMLPGGGVEPHEDLLCGLARAVMEETGHKVLDAKLAVVHHKTERKAVLLVFHCDAEGDIRSFTENPESSDIRYFPVDALPDNTPETHRQRIMAFQSYDNHPTILIN